ncbi:MAG: hypothetical protein DSY80_08960 [Desulfocapsa sp.]|nr:MAG: hypothetical protein DSY80_08960 [Desulfocapsa sp.]
MSGWVSKTDDFHEVVNEMGLNLWDNYQEDYAQIYDLADGCKDKMPIELQDFYDWNLAKRLIN